MLQVIFWIGGPTPVTGGSRRFHSQNGTGMLIALWIINGLLALAFLGAGGMKLLRGKTPWPRPV